MVTDKDTGKPKGYGFCEFHDVATASSAVRNLNKFDVSGRMLRVDYADEHMGEPRKRERGGDFRPGGGGGGERERGGEGGGFREREKGGGGEAGGDGRA